MDWTVSRTSSYEGLATLTRYRDPSTNSDKYRRFLVIWPKGMPWEKLLLTHTGRWTRHTDRGDWSGGTYRFGTTATAKWEIQGPPSVFLEKHTARKLGQYYVAHALRPMSTSEINCALNRCAGDIAARLGGTATQPATAVDLSTDVQAAVNQANPGPPVRPALNLGTGMALAHLDAHANWLTIAAAHPDTDQLALLSAYTEINDAAKRARASLDAVLLELGTALDLIVAK